MAEIEVRFYHFTTREAHHQIQRDGVILPKAQRCESDWCNEDHPTEPVVWLTTEKYPTIPNSCRKDTQIRYLVRSYSAVKWTRYAKRAGAEPDWIADSLTARPSMHYYWLTTNPIPADRWQRVDDMYKISQRKPRTPGFDFAVRHEALLSQAMFDPNVEKNLPSLNIIGDD